MVFAVMMPDPQWVTLFDVRRDLPPTFLFPVVGFFFVLIGFVQSRIKHYERDAAGESYVVRGSAAGRRMLIFAVGFTFLATAIAVVPHARLIHALRAGRYEKVEGTVTSFVSADVIRKTPERWSVGDRTYEFHDARARSGLSSPGLVQPGMYVRIADVDGVIVRLEALR